jgi:hypothetical protein
LNAIAGREEPIFPYLAISFAGSIMGVVLSQKREDIKKEWSFFPKRIMQIGLVMFLVGIIGLIVNLILMMDTLGIENTMLFYTGLPFHRNWVPENGVPFAGWLFQFLSLNGAAICLIMVVVRAVEYRGRGKEFANKTKFIRRFGFVAFTMYNIQWIYFIAHLYVSSVFYFAPYSLLDWTGTFLTMIVAFSIFYGILRAWEKVKYTGSLEWTMGTIAAKIIPTRKVEGKWWRSGQLNVEEAFYNAEWLNIIERDEVSRRKFADSKFAFKLSFFGFIFFPISFITYLIARGSIEREQHNRYYKRAKIISLIGIIFFLGWLIPSLFLSLGDLGLSL